MQWLPSRDCFWGWEFAEDWNGGGVRGEFRSLGTVVGLETARPRSNTFELLENYTPFSKS